MPDAIHCRYHCTACDAHFASLVAFDAHRAGPYRKRRRCLSGQEVRGLRKEDNSRVMRLVRNGVCRLTKDNERLEGVGVWQTR